MLKRLFKLALRADHGTRVHANNAVLSSRFDHLCVNTSNPEKLANNTRVKLEPIRRDQRPAHEVASRHSVIEQGRCISIASATNDR